MEVDHQHSAVGFETGSGLGGLGEADEGLGGRGHGGDVKIVEEIAGMNRN